MNVVLLYGNGLDRALGLETSYSDFLKWTADIHTREENFTPSAYEFLDIIRAHKNDGIWSDYECALGLCHYDTMTSCGGFRSFDYATNTVFAVQDLLRSFLKEKCNKFNELAITDAVRDAFVAGFYRLCHENGFEFVDQVHLVTLNYTYSLETILCQNMVFHPHGELKHNSPLIFGVDSKRQLKNLNCGEFARLLYKRGQIEENTISGENNDDKLMRIIKNADVLILFGLSFGPSDYRIWKAVSRCSAERGAKIILCPFNDDVVAKFKRGMSQWGLCAKEVDRGQLLLWQQVSANIITARDSKKDFLGLNAVKEMLGCN